MTSTQPPSGPKSFGKTAKRSAVWDLAGRTTSQGVLFAASVLLARLLTPADFGITAASRFFIGLASRITQLGLNASLVRMKHIRPEHASSVFVVNLVMGGAAFVALYAASPLLGRVFDSADVAKVLPVTALVFLITPFGSVAAAMLNRHLRYRESTIIQWLDSVSGTLISLLLAYLGFGYWSLVIGALAGTVLSTAAKVYASPWRPTLRFSGAALKETLSFGAGVHAKRLLQFSAGNLDNLVVGRMLGVQALGFYDKGFGLMRQFTDRLVFDNSLMRIFAIIHEQPDRFRRALLKGILATSTFSIPLLSIFAITADRLIPVLFGPQWEPAIRPFQILAVVGIFKAAGRAVHAANEAAGRVWAQTVQELLFIVLMIAGIAVGSRWGLNAATLGLLPAILVHSLFALYLLTRHSVVSSGDIVRALTPAVLSSAAMCLVVLGAERALASMAPMGPAPTLGVLLLLGGATYAALILWTPFAAMRDLVNEMVDDLAPGIRRWVRIGVLRAGTDKVFAPAQPESAAR